MAFFTSVPEDSLERFKDFASHWVIKPCSQKYGCRFSVHKTIDLE